MIAFSCQSLDMIYIGRLIQIPAFKFIIFCLVHTIFMDIHNKYPLGKVKPGYKKKRKEIIQKEARKAKRNYINEVYKRKNKGTIINDENR